MPAALLRLLRGLLKAGALAALGVFLAFFVLSVPAVRKSARLSRSTPDAFEAWFGSPDRPVGPRVTPLDEMDNAAAHPHRFKRLSWQGVENAPPPDSPAANPLRGGTQLLSYHPRKEMLLSRTLRASHLPDPILRVGVYSLVPSRTAGSAREAGANHPRPRGYRCTPRLGPDTLICYIEAWSGVPMSRPAVEETAERAIDCAFRIFPRCVEVDIVAVPWREIRGHKPPDFFSAAVRRTRWHPIEGACSAGENLRLSSAVWLDSHAMADYPVGTGPVAPPPHQPPVRAGKTVTTRERQHH